MASRRKATSYDALKRSRSSFVGAITKGRAKLLIMRDGGVETYNVAEIRRILKSTAATTSKFQNNVDEAYEFTSVDTNYEVLQEEEDEALSTFEDSATEVTDMAEELLATVSLTFKLNDFKATIKAIRDCSAMKPEVSQEEPLKRLRKELEELKLAWEQSGLSMAHPLRAEFDHCCPLLATLETEISKPAPIAPPLSLDESISAGSTFRDFQHYSKIPDRSLPKFNGNVMKWAEFWEDFQCQIGEKEYLAEPDKIGYLRSCITDPEATEMLHCPRQKAGMYLELVEKLKKRYDRVNEIHRTLVQRVNTMEKARHNRSEMRKLIETYQNTMASIERTGYNSMSHYYASRLYHLLPTEVQTKWDHHTSSAREVPEVKAMLEYLTKHTEGLPAKPPHPGRQEHQSELRPQRKQRFDKPKHNVPIAAAAPVSTPVSTPVAAPKSATVPSHPPYKWECTLCAPDRHPLFLCQKWQGMTVAQRKKHATSKKLCLNCLAMGHETERCWSKFKCKDCGGNHHTTLHQTPATPINSATIQATDVTALLITCRVMLIGPDGRKKPARALLDTGSAMNILSTRMSESLHLPLTKAELQFKKAMGGELSHSNHMTEVIVASLKPGQPRLLIRAAVVNHVVDDLPVVKTSPASAFDHLQGLDLADPLYHLPDRVDLFLGASAFFKLVETDRIVEGPPGTPTAISTIFGWGVGGAINQNSTCQKLIPVYTCSPTPVSINEQDHLQQEFQQFWQGEELEGIIGEVAPTDELVEEHYVKHVSYSPDRQRYTVALPRREDVPPLGESRPQALARYLNHERAVIRKGTHQPYQAVMQEYFTLNHAEEVPAELSLPTEHFYMPMHAVTKETSTSTKLRVVFDGSALTTNGMSLNNILHSGPTIQPTLSQTLLRFRSYPIGLSADIAKMYREVELEEKDRDLHRFLWREQPTDPVKDFRMTRVTFGISCSPFLAIRTLEQVATDHAEDDPVVQHHLRESFYVDDFLAGAATPAEATELPGRMRDVLSKAGMNLCKWRCNEPAILQDMPEELKEKQKVLSLSGNKTIIHSKTLGVQWHTEEDSMFPDLTLPERHSTTKRGLMSDISRLFDILGWVSPAIVKMKIQYQELWALGIGWDEQLPTTIKKLHAKWREQLPILAKLKIPRHYYLTSEQTLTISLHGFADASMKAYGAVVYLRSTYQHQPPLITLVASKTKVAPRIKPSKENKHPKGLTVSRLELCGAHLLSKLLVTIRDTLKIPSSDVFAWSDSSCVLSWLDGNPRDFQVFVTNRVTKILEAVPPDHWRHVPTAENPADVASRGLFPAELATHKLWWDGPDWLKMEPLKEPPQPPRRPLCVPGRRAIPLHVVSVDVSFDIEERCEVYLKLLHHTAWWVRYMDLLKPGSHSPPSSGLTLANLKKAELILVRRSQNRSFHPELTHLKRTNTISPSSKLLPLTPFLDSEKTLRVGGRLAHSALTNNQVHPIILDARDKFVKLYFVHMHLTLGHCGPSLLLCHTGLRYHILGAKRLAKTVCNRCTTCIKMSKATREQLMGQLPSDRVKPCPPFYVTGIDYAGPFKLKMGHVRKPCFVTAHVAVFLCFTTRAVHLELVSDETTEAFIAALRRFIGRRGCPHTIHSDNGGNFQGAKNDLMALQTMLRTAVSSGEFESFLLHKEITWKMTPARSPHFGGLWEAGVKSMKYHLRRMMGSEKLNSEQFRTVLCQIEAILNSRPMMPLDSHSTEGVTALTSGHFLIGRPLTAYPETDIKVEPRLLKSWNKCQSLTQGFWNRWSTEYLRSLQARKKWRKEADNIQPGDVVILKETSAFKVKWPLARVLQTFPGSDGKVRVVLLKTESSTYKRPVSKIALLHREEPDVSSPKTSPGRMLRPRPLPDEPLPGLQAAQQPLLLPPTTST